MPEATTSVDAATLADAIRMLDSITRRMDAFELSSGHKNPYKGDDDDDKKDSSKKDAAKSKADDDDDDDDKKADTTVKTKILDDDEEHEKSDAAKGVKGDAKKAKSDDGELEIKHGKDDSSKKKADARKADEFPEKEEKEEKCDDDDDRKDSSKKADAKKKADAEEKDKKDDSARADAVSELRRQVADQARTIANLTTLLKPRSDEEHSAFADTQAKADAVFGGFGQRAPRPLDGEKLDDYRLRLATKLKSHSPQWKSVKLSQLPGDAFTVAETQVYADATAAAANPVDLKAGELREVTKIDPTTGLRTIVFYGNECFTKGMGRPGRRVTGFRVQPSQ